MGGCQSKPQPVASAPPKSGQPPPQSIKRVNSKSSLGSHSGHRRRKPQDDASSKKSARRQSDPRDSSKQRNGTANRRIGGAPADAQWKILWEKYHPMLIDPADVHAVLEELMAKTTDQLSATEMMLLQRRVRFVVRSLGSSSATPSTKLSRFYSSAGTQSTNDSESKMIAEKQHLLDQTAIRKIFSGGDALSKQPSEEFRTLVRIPKPNGDSVDMIGSAYVLMQSLCGDWDLTEHIALETASELDMDVNHQDGQEEASIKAPPLPLPMDPTNADPPPMGVTLSSVAFVMGLALRGTRYQRLQLLFFLMFPPNHLEQFLASHPAGGVPTFLLEVGNDTIISVASLAHYYYYCNASLPTEDSVSLSETLTQNGSPKETGQVSACHAADALATLVFSKDTIQVNGGDLAVSSQSIKDASDHSTSTKTQQSPSRNNSGYGSMFRRNSDRGGEKEHLWNNNDSPKSYWMDYLRDVREGGAVSYRDAALEESKDRLLKSSMDIKDGTRWTMKEFFQWADEAVDDTALDAIVNRVFATGILPSPSAECDMVLRHWIEWQKASAALWSTDDSNDGGAILDYLTQSVRSVFRGIDVSMDSAAESSKVWGGLGGYDGRGGLGHGLLYCIDKKWWDEWENYVGWSWDGESNAPLSGKRPGDLSTERLLDRKTESVVAGTLGSYEVMKQGLTKGADYVLVPPIVWNTLYEVYGGGPSLPRMVLPPMKMTNPRERTFSSDSKQMEEEDMAQSVEIVPSDSIASPLKIPEEVLVATHPWLLSAHVCDAQQPYRRGDAGPTSVRIMVTPDQPLWRLYAELVARLQVNHAKAADSDGLGRARIWKRLDATTNAKDSTCRYGPWVLLCKNRHATLPVMPHSVDRDDISDLVEDWKSYADHATVESIGLANNDRIMIEYAVKNKSGDFVWPREAAAKAGRVRHLAAEDAKFRQMLRGVDENGKLLAEPPELVGMSVDAMDASGCWYQVEVLQVENSDATDESEDGGEVMESSEGGTGQGSYGYDAEKKEGDSRSKQVRVDFSEHGGHSEWIDIDSDRLAKAGRFTVGSDERGDTKSNGGTNAQSSTDPKAKSAASGKKGGNDSTVDQNGGGKVCTFPGYGACGLANLGNTCYANSALQCISYIPLLRAYLISGQYKTSGDLNKDNPLGTGGKLLEEFAELLRVMWSGKYGERTPTRFRSQLGKARSQFSGADQQDAQELLSYMLDVLHEDSNKVKKKPYVEALEDDWVKKNKLPRVGQEAWRRFLRRNRSIMADVTMGQVLNTVTCPVCHFSSRNFDPFNLLSLPFPTVADVVFQCTVIRRASAYNCPEILNRPRKGHSGKVRFQGSKSRSPKPPSDQLVYEQYVIAMSRLADIGDLRLQLQNISGIPANRFRLCRVEEVVVDSEADEVNPVRTYLKSIALPDKEGPCVQVAKKGSTDEEGGEKNRPTHIIAFESTLNPRPPQLAQNGHSEAPQKSGSNREEEESSSTTEDEDDDDESEARASKTRARRDHQALMQLLETYGDSKECRIYDSDPLPISKAISRCLWPKNEKQFKLGLRVDAIDHRNHWFPGSVVEIVEGVASEHSETSADNESPTKTKVRIHFDNFSSKWDETYTIDQFLKGQVRPVYSHATPRVKPTEFVVYHRYVDRKKKGNALFGRGFYLQCQNEWSTARAGAHILAQASRFMLRRSDSSSVVDVDDLEAQSKTRRIYDKAHAAVSDLIDLLVDYDRQYMRSALGVAGDNSSLSQRKRDTKSFRNPSFDASALSTSLIEKVRSLLYRLPFEVRVCTADAPMGSKSGQSNEEVPFPFSLMRTIGNFMNARHSVVLHWRDPPLEKKSKNPPATYLASPVMYIKPEIVVHKQSLALLNENEAKRSKNNPGSGGLHLGVCLTEFCRVQQLHLSDNWRCPRCKEFREGKQNMDLWKLPDVLTFHIKRFNCSARWREKITTKINFPLTGLDMSEWYHKESPAMRQGSDDAHVYDLIGVMNHYGGMTGGHYVATCKATACSADGNEEVAHNFNGAGTSFFGSEEETGVQTGWRLGRSKEKESATTQNRMAAVAAAKAAAESAEPLWLQFDDDLVEPIPPRNVVSEMAYVLFYRRRHLTPSNIAKYSTIHC